VRTQPDELAFWLPTKAALLAMGAMLSAKQQQQLVKTYRGLAERQEKAGNTVVSNFLHDLAGDVWEEKKKPQLRLIKE
jgi:hypothetical protein